MLTASEIRQMKKAMAQIASESRSLPRPTPCAHQSDASSCPTCIRIAELRAGR